MFAEAKRRDPKQLRLWSVIVDGDGKQLGHIKQAAKKHQANVTIIMDIVHVSEPLGSIKAISLLPSIQHYCRFFVQT